MQNVLFVCYGNICRSPMAEAIFNHLLEERGLTDTIDCRSVATGSHERGNPPHPGALKELTKHGLTLNHRSTPMVPADFDWADLVITMDDDNLWTLEQRAPADQLTKIHLAMSIVPGHEQEEIPDPWYDHRFDRTYAMLSESLPLWLDQLQNKSDA